MAAGGGNFSGATNIDAIAEVNVQMGAYTAEYGLKGGTQVNFITKRGGEHYHGTAYWYIRNEWFNANTWLGNHTNLPNGVRRPVYRFSTQGGNIGGPVPVKIPVLNPKGNQLFFFYSLDDTQMKEPASIRQWTLPSMLERQGDFSQSAVKPKDPLNNNAPFPNNVIPADRRNAASVAIMNLFPVPNCTGLRRDTTSSSRKPAWTIPGGSTCIALTCGRPTRTPSASSTRPGTRRARASK